MCVPAFVLWDCGLGLHEMLLLGFFVAWASVDVVYFWWGLIVCTDLCKLFNALEASFV